MKTLKTFVLCTALAGCALTATASRVQNGTARDLIDTAMSVHRFDTFLMLVRDADLTFELKGSGPFTIFAPTDDAFAKVSPDWLEKIHGNKPRLRQFLLHHIVRGNWSAQDAVRAKSLSPLWGTQLTTQNVNGHGTVNGAGFTIANVQTSNGMLHGMDTVFEAK